MTDWSPTVREWRARATRLDAYARTLRREGLQADATDAEAAAADYRLGADELEAGGPENVNAHVRDVERRRSLW